MTSAQWNQIKFFKPYEFDSPDDPGSGVRMQFDLMTKLDYLREEVGFPLIINSGVRTPAHNADVGGVDGSSHESGYAADIFARTSLARHAILAAAFKLGFRRAGIAKTFIHLDTDPSKPQDVIWLY